MLSCVRRNSGSIVQLNIILIPLMHVVIFFFFFKLYFLSPRVSKPTLSSCTFLIFHMYEHIKSETVLISFFLRLTSFISLCLESLT